MSEEVKVSKGWKTITAGITGILGSLAAIGSGIMKDPVDFTMIWGGVAGVISSLAVLGIGGKLQKLTATITRAANGQ